MRLITCLVLSSAALALTLRSATAGGKAAGLSALAVADAAVEAAEEETINLAVTGMT